MGKKDNRYAFMNPIAMARSQRRQVSGPTLTDYFNRERMSWEEVKALLEKRKEKTNSLAAFEDHDLNLLHKAALERRREKLLAKAEEQGPAFVYEPVEKNVKNSDSDSSSSDVDSQPSKSSSSRKRKRKDRKKDKRKSKKRKKSKRGGSNNSDSDSDSDSDSMPSSSDDSDTERRRRKKKRKEKKSKKRRD